MEPHQAKQILLKVSAIWSRQPTDDVVQAEWSECLSRVSFEAALEAVREMRDGGRGDAPTPGEVYALAKDVDKRLVDERRRSMRLIEHDVTAEQRAENIRKLRKIQDDLSAKLKLRR